VTRTNYYTLEHHKPPQIRQAGSQFARYTNDAECTAVNTCLCGHDKTAGTGVEIDVSCHQAYVFILLLEFTVLLITQCFDRGGVDHSSLFFQSQADGILRYDRLQSEDGKVTVARAPTVRA